MPDDKPPFRAEHVGSFPRPERLMQARDDFAAGTIGKEELKRVELDAIRAIVALQERVGIGAVTDGEFPKTGWREFLFEKCDGFAKEPSPPAFMFMMYDGSEWAAQGEPRVVAKLRRREPLSADDFSVLKGLTDRPKKANVPTPSIAHFNGDALLDKSVYPMRALFFADLARIMREEIADLSARGCTYLQMDEVPIAVLCDPKNQAIVRGRGEDPDELIDTYIDAINHSVRGRPAGMTVAVHMCRGNRDHGMADGGYEPVAERVFNRLDVDGFFLEYDTPRAGDFAPLRFLPKGKMAILGLVSTKVHALETVDALRRRVEEAARFVPLDQIGLCPQCGFASTYTTARFSRAEEEQKLARVMEAAVAIWG